MRQWNKDGQEEPAEPGQIAAIDQMSAEFRGLRERLAGLHAQAVGIIAEPEQDDNPQRMALVQAELHLVMLDAFESEQSLNKICSFVMYLINDICEMRQRDDNMGDLINQVGDQVNIILEKLNSMADSIGMEPVAEPVHDQDGRVRGWLG